MLITIDIPMYVDQYSYSVSLPLSTVHSVKPLGPVVLEASGLRMPEGVIVLGKNFSSLKVTKAICK